MSLLYATGPKANLLERGLTITSTNADANYPLTYLYDEVPSREFRFASAGADRLVTVDLDHLLGFGDMETAGTLPGGWTDRSTGTGTATRSTANPHAGAAHLRLAAGASGVAAASRDITVYPDDLLTVFSLWIDSNGTDYCELWIQEIGGTGKYLTSAATWQASPTYAVRGNGAAYADVGGLQAAVQSYLLTQTEPITLRCTLRTTVNANVDVDDFVIGVAPNALTIHGHNVPMEIAVEWRHSTDNSSYATLTTGSPYQPSFYLAGTTTRRFQQFRVPGTPSDGTITLLGELGLWKAKTAVRSVNLESRTETIPRLIRNEVGGHVRIHRQGVQAPRVHRFTKTMVSASEFQTIRDDLARAHGGAYPILWIPDTLAPAPIPVMYGVVPPMTSWVQPLPTALSLWTTDEIEIHEQPFPVGVL